MMIHFRPHLRNHMPRRAPQLIFYQEDHDDSTNKMPMIVKYGVEP